MAVDIGSAIGYLDLDIQGFLSALNEANTAAQTKTQTLGNTLGNGLSDIGNQITGAGKTLTVGLTAPIIGAGTAALNLTKDFDKSMSQVAAVSGATGDDFDALRSKAREMGATTKFSASDAADAMNYMAMAGWKTDQMLGGVKGIMDLAAASGEDLATTSDIVTDSLTAFGMSAEESGRLADIMAAASSNANTNVSMLGESFKYVAPLAGAMGYSAEDVSTALGLMANAGIKASQGGTSLRTVLTNLVNPSDEVAMALDYMNISLQNEDGSMKSLKDVMVDLRNGFGDLKISEEEFTEGIGKLDEQLANGEITQKQYNDMVEDWINKTFTAEDALKGQFAATIAGQTGLSGLLAIVNASDEDFEKLSNSIENSNGAAENMAKVMQDNLAGQIDVIKSGLQELAISFGDIMMPVVTSFASGIQNVVDGLNNLDDNQKTMIMRIALVVAAVGPLLMVFGGLLSGVAGLIKNFETVSTAISNVKTGMTLLQPVFVGISAPVIALVAVIGILVAAFVTLWNTNEGFRNAVIEIFNQVKQTISNFVSEVQKRFDALKPFINAFITFFKNVWNQFCNFLAPVFITVFKLISNQLKSFLDLILGILDVFIGIFTGDWDKVWNGVKTIFSSIWENITNTFNTISEALLSIVSGMISSVVEYFQNLYESISSAISDILDSIISWATNMATEAYNAGSEFVSKLMEFINNLPGLITEVFNTVVSTLVSWVSDMAEKGAEGASSLVDAVIDGISSLPDQMVSIGWDIVNGVWNGILDAKDYFYDNVSGFFSGIVDSVKSILGIHSPSTVFENEIGKEIPPGAANGIKRAMPTLYRSAVDGFSNLVEDVSGSLKPISIKSVADSINVKNTNGSSISPYISSIVGGSKGIITEENIQMFAEVFYNILKDAPIVNNVNVNMEDGDVVLDGERVGRKLAPVVSRVQATGSI